MVNGYGKSWPNGREWTHNRKVASSSLGRTGIVGWVSECTARTLYDEVPLSKAPNPQNERHSINGCPLLWVCVHSV